MSRVPHHVPVRQQDAGHRGHLDEHPRAVVPHAVAGYMDRVWASPGVVAWVQGALAEREFLAFEEPYRSAR